MAQKVTVNMSAQVAMREIVGNTMADMGGRYPQMVLVSADVDTSSRVQGFVERFPERHYNIGIAEQNMMSFAAGLAQEGAIPFCFTFAPFASMRACEQVRTDICYPNLPVRIVANYSGYSGGKSGCTHCALEDVAIMSSFGNMCVIEPADPYLCAKVMEATMDWEGPVYIRLAREAAPQLYPQELPYQIGRALILREGEDGAFICAGITVHFALEAAERLKKELGVNVRVVDMHTIKPLDRQAVEAAGRTGRVVVAQDHNIIGGLGYMVSAALMEAGISCKFVIRGCPDKFVPLASPEFLYHLNQYDAEGLYQTMREMF